MKEFCFRRGALPAGLTLRAVGENHASAHVLGLPVIGTQLAAVAFGGACAGLAGAYLSLVYTPMWTENMVAGRGWIALALVVFSAWKPAWLAFGAVAGPIPDTGRTTGHWLGCMPEPPHRPLKMIVGLREMS